MVTPLRNGYLGSCQQRSRRVAVFEDKSSTTIVFNGLGRPAAVLCCVGILTVLGLWETGETSRQSEEALLTELRTRSRSEEQLVGEGTRLSMCTEEGPLLLGSGTTRADPKGRGRELTFRPSQVAGSLRELLLIWVQKPQRSQPPFPTATCSSGGWRWVKCSLLLCASSSRRVQGPSLLSRYLTPIS